MDFQSILRGIGLVLFLAGLAFPGAEPKIVRLESRTFPNLIVWDSNYTACLVASDGLWAPALFMRGAQRSPSPPVIISFRIAPFRGPVT